MTKHTFSSSEKGFGFFFFLDKLVTLITLGFLGRSAEPAIVIVKEFTKQPVGGIGEYAK